jgi:hypothetical protein
MPVVIVRSNAASRFETPREIVRAASRGRACSGTTPSRCAAGRTPLRSWTGRAANSCATDSGLPLLVTAGTHRTRVSEMRRAAARRRRPVMHLVQTTPTPLTAALAHPARRRRGPSPTRDPGSG